MTDMLTTVTTEPKIAVKPPAIERLDELEIVCNPKTQVTTRPQLVEPE